MALFKKRETLTQNIAYMAIMAAINVVFVLITTLVPVLMVLLVLVLPLTNVVVTLFCKKKYFIIYAITTICLCMLVTMWNNISDTFLYVIPSIISGFIFGIMIEKKIPAIYILIVTSIIQFASSYALIPFIKFAFDTDIVYVFLTAFGLKDFQYNDFLVPTFIAFIAIAQSTLAYIFIKKEIPKLGYEVNENDKFYFILPTLELLSIGLFILLAFFIPSFSFTFMVLALLISIYLLVDMLIESNVYIWVILVLCLIGSIFLFAFLYQFIPKPFGISLMMSFFVLESIIATSYKYLFKLRKNHDKITNGNKL